MELKLCVQCYHIGSVVAIANGIHICCSTRSDEPRTARRLDVDRWAEDFKISRRWNGAFWQSNYVFLLSWAPKFVRHGF